MAKVAIVEAKGSRNNYEKLFMGEFEFEKFVLCSDPTVTKVLKKNVDIDINVTDFDWVILVGSEATKYYTNLKSVTEYSGKLVDKKFLPVINPSMIVFKPEVQKVWDESRDSIIEYILGVRHETIIDDDTAIGIQDKQQALDFIEKALKFNNPFISLDSETSALYPRDGHVLGISISYMDDYGAYIDADIIDEEIEEKLQELFNKKIVVFHNAKFDISFFKYHFNWTFPRFEDTMLEHYVLDETVGTHGLKQLALKYTKYGDYEKPMQDWIDEHCRKNHVLKGDFNYGMIPFPVIKTYAAMDAVVTFLLHKRFSALINKNPKFINVYKEILLPGCGFLVEVQDAGIPFDVNRLRLAQDMLQKEISGLVEELMQDPDVLQFIKINGEFNPNSTVQLRKLLFDYIKLTPTGKRTAKGAVSTDSEVLQELGLEHPIPKKILQIRKLTKIKNTYIDKILPQLDKDGRIRTGFNQHVTTSGRLSSSGKLNAQQFPRDNPLVKGCIVAPLERKIVGADLVTAEVYVAAVLSKDKALQEVFKSKGNFHSAIAKKVFKLPCAVEEVAKLYSKERQFAKAITFGIMYGAGPKKIWSQVLKDGGDITLREASEIIDEYFREFKGLKKWIDETRGFIEANMFIYSHFGRKRRLPGVQNSNPGLADHEVRSGLNFAVQSPASDINFLGAMEAAVELKKAGVDATIFALVHDSILADVADADIERYQEIVTRCMHRERGISIPGCPIGIEFEIHQDYSMGKLEKMYPEVLLAA